MKYIHSVGTIKEPKKALFAAVALVFAAATILTLWGAAEAGKGGKPVSGPGKVSVGVDVSTWESGSPSGEGLIPIGGAGQVNGEFTTAERNGIQIGLRAQERFVGPIDAGSNKNSKVGLYSSTTNEDTASWNYDWHVDLRNAKGVAKGTTLSDYSISLETDIADSLFALPVPLDLTFGGMVPGDTVLYQSSQNPTFGNDVFNPSVPGVYNFRLVLEPTTFNGPQLAVAIQVNVTESVE